MKKEKMYLINRSWHQILSVLGYLIFAFNYTTRIAIFFTICLCLCLNIVSAQNNSAQNSTLTSGDINFSKLFDFENFTSGSYPSEIVKSGNFLHGVTINGGSDESNGVLYKIKTDGTEHTGISFQGYYIPNSLTIIDTMIYGILYDGKGVGNWKGILYRVNTNGNGFEIIHYFDDTNLPEYIITAFDNTIYGTASGRWDGIGYLFKINPDGSGFTKFQSIGAFPYGKIIYADNYLYGTTSEVFSPPGNHGTVYRIKPDGTDFSELHRFDSINGRTPAVSLTAIDSFLYGTTKWGGLNDNGVIFRIKKDGTNFQVLHEFNQEEGAGSLTKLVYSGKSLYGATRIDGLYGYGTLFRINPDGTNFEKLFDFQGNDGSGPGDMLISNDTIWGITDYGGIYNDGTIFRYIIDESQATPDEPLKIITLSISRPEEISLETQKNLIIETGSLIDLDTLFSVEGNIPYTHTWNVKTGYDYQEVNNTVNINENVTFYLFVSTTQGCTYTDSVTVQAKNATGIEERVTNENKITLYPNPTPGVFQIEIQDGNANYEFDIFDISARKVANGIFYCQSIECIHTINLENLKPGVYNLVVRKGDKFFAQKKLVIVRL